MNRHPSVECFASDSSPPDRENDDHENIFYDPSGPYVPMLDAASVHHASEAVVDSVFQRDDDTAAFDAPATHECHVDFRHSIRPATSNTKQATHRPKHPPPSDELVIGYHENDVLSGRGATINAHPGNVRFRKLCVIRKQEFDAATNAHKRSIATNVVEEILAQDPPGRFLERVDDGTAAAFEEQYLSSLDAELDIDKIMNGASLDYFKSIGVNCGNVVKSKAWIKHVGPWKDIGVEKAIQKACGVIRDYKRPDKVALRAMSASKKRKCTTEDEARTNNMPIIDVAEDNSIGTEHALNPPNGQIAPTINDVLIGRGAFINNYAGNVKFRTFASPYKQRFDRASGSEKRTISLEIVTQMKRLDPPARFLKRPDHAIRRPVPLSNGKYRLAPRGLDGPWEEVSLDKACLKVCQSLRDLKQSEHEVPQHTLHGDVFYDAQEELLSDVAAGHIDHYEHPSPSHVSCVQHEDPGYMMEGSADSML